MQDFVLVRDKDVTGKSGTGVVAEGVVFTDGFAICISWQSLDEISFHVHEDSLKPIVPFAPDQNLLPVHTQPAFSTVDITNRKEYKFFLVFHLALRSSHVHAAVPKLPGPWLSPF